MSLDVADIAFEIFAKKEPQCFLFYIVLRGDESKCIVAGKELEMPMSVMRNIAYSPVLSNAVINYAITIRLFQTVLRTCLKNFSSNNSMFKLPECSVKISKFNSFDIDSFSLIVPQLAY